MAQVHNGVPALVYRMEDVVPEELYNVSIARFGPTRVAIKSIKKIEFSVRTDLRIGCKSRTLASR